MDKPSGRKWLGLHVSLAEEMSTRGLRFVLVGRLSGSSGCLLAPRSLKSKHQEGKHEGIGGGHSHLQKVSDMLRIVNIIVSNDGLEVCCHFGLHNGIVGSLYDLNHGPSST